MAILKVTKVKPKPESPPADDEKKPRRRRRKNRQGSGPVRRWEAT